MIMSDIQSVHEDEIPQGTLRLVEDGETTMSYTASPNGTILPYIGDPIGPWETPQPFSPVPTTTSHSLYTTGCSKAQCKEAVLEALAEFYGEETGDEKFILVESDYQKPYVLPGVTFVEAVEEISRQVEKGRSVTTVREVVTTNKAVVKRSSVTVEYS